jgi:hypothetical protein
MKAEWRHHLDELLVHTDAILRLSHDLYERKIEYTADDKAELMVLGFASRQDGHLRAIQDLVRCGHHSDATLVARTAFEGAAQLTWAVGESPNRPETWFWYGIIEDWRQTKVNRARGIELSAEQQAVLDEALREWGDRYLTDKARKRVENGQPPIADPYRRKWADLDLASICRELDASWSAYYNHIYRTFSDWVHWSPRSLFLNVEFENGNATGFRKEDPHSAAIALKVGEFALFQTLRILDWKFGLKIDKQIMALHDKFTLEANKVLPPPFK